MDIYRDIAVTYTGAVLRPDERLDLPEGTRLRAALRPLPDPAAEAQARDAILRLRDSSIIRPGGKVKKTRGQARKRG